MTECRCGRPTRDQRYVCDACRHELDVALGDCSWLEEELDITLTRQRATVTTGGSRSSVRPLPWHDRAAEVKRTLHGLLVTWVRFCAEEDIKGAPAYHPESGWPRDTISSCARWLTNATDGLALHDIGPEAVDEITDAVAAARRVVFWKRRSRVYLGPCAYGSSPRDVLEAAVLDCPGDVYANEGEPVGYCEVCERGVTVVIRQSELDDDLRSRLLSAAEIADWSVRMGLNASREEVRKRVLYWHRHKRVDARSHERRDGKPVPLFRYGDVRMLLAAEYGQRDTA